MAGKHKTRLVGWHPSDPAAVEWLDAEIARRGGGRGAQSAILDAALGNAMDAGVNPATDRWLIAEARRIAPGLFANPSRDHIRVAAGLLREMADRLQGRAAARCGDHHASGVTNCTLKAGHDGAHHNGSGLTWDRRPAAQAAED